MASNAAKAVTGAGDDLRKVQSGRAEASEIHQAATARQDRLCAIAVKNSRKRYEIWLRTFSDGSRRVVLALRERNGRGVFRDAGPTLVFSVDEIDAIHELLDEVSFEATREGLLS